MDDLRIEELTEIERETLRSYTRHGSLSGVALELNKSLETIRARTRGARKTLKVNTTAEAAAKLAAAEGRIPLWGASFGAMGSHPTVGQSAAVDVSESAQLVRDNVQAVWRPFELDAPSNIGRQLRSKSIVRELRTVFHLAVATVALIAIGLLIMTLLPKAVSWNAFQPDDRLSPGGSK